MGLHLWYLFLLLLFSVLMLPLLRYLKQANRAAILLQKLPWLQGELFLVVAVVCTGIIEALVNLSPDVLGRRDMGGWSPWTYLVGFFLCGYLLSLNPKVLSSFERNRMSTLLLGRARHFFTSSWWRGTALLPTASPFLFCVPSTPGCGLPRSSGLPGGTWAFTRPCWLRPIKRSYPFTSCITPLSSSSLFFCSRGISQTRRNSCSLFWSPLASSLACTRDSFGLSRHCGFSLA